MVPRMKLKRILSLVIVGATVLGSIVFLRQRYESQSFRSTKFIIIVLDALRADHVGVYGYGRNTAPHLDALAQQSFIFTNAFSAASYTLASTASLFTSTYWPRHKVIGTSDKLPATVVTLAEVLKENGFSTAAFSHAPYVTETFGFHQGFDHFDWIEHKYHFDPSVPFRNAATWLSNNRPSSFMIYIHIMPPHTPYSPPPPFKTAFTDPNYGGNAIPSATYILKMDSREVPFEEGDVQWLIDCYDGNIMYADAALGEFFALLKAMELYDETTIIVTSDHGEAFGEHGRFMHNSTVYDEMIHIPLVVKPAEGAERGAYITEVVSNIDIMPTLLDMATINYQKLDLQGRNFRKRLQGKRLNHPRFVLANSAVGTFCVRTDHFKLIYSADGGVKLFRVGDTHSREMEDVSSSHAREVKTMLGVLMDVVSHHGEQVEAGSPGGEKAELPEEIREVLRSLGYTE